MWPSCRTSDTWEVNETSRDRRILVGVSPRLLCDVLTLALEEEGLEAVLYPDVIEAGNDAPAHVDVALVSGGLPSDVTADTILVLDESGTRVALVREGHERDLPPDGELTRLVELLGGLLWA